MGSLIISPLRLSPQYPAPLSPECRQHQDYNEQFHRELNIPQSLNVVLIRSLRAQVPTLITARRVHLLAAWVWSERNDDDDEYPRPPGPPGDNDSVYNRPGYRADGSVITGPPSYADVRPGEVAYGTAPGPRPEESQSYMARMSGALRRTPSPQQVFDSASRSVVGGIGAVGDVVGSALGSIREEDRNAFRDHNAWSEEAEARSIPAQAPIDMRSSENIPGVAPSQRMPVNNGKRKTVAIVVSADSHSDDF